MEWDDLVCGICKEIYNEADKTPKILISCGHTFCSSCLETIKTTIKNRDSEPEYQITCPEDNEIHNYKNSLDDFPRNMSLIRLIKKQNDAGKNTYRSQNYDSRMSVNSLITPVKNKDSDPNNINENEFNNGNFNLNNENNNQNINNNNNNANQEANSSIRKSVRKGLYSGAMNNFSYSNVNMKYCLLHNNRPLEILCLDHNLRLCSNCALFGEHKNHNIINEEDYVKELEIKAEVLMDFFELIDKNCSNLDFNFSNGNSNLNNNHNNNNNTATTQNQNNLWNHNSNSKTAAGNLEKAILGIEKIDKLGVIGQNNNLNINNNSQSESNVNNKNTTDITDNISTNSMINPRDFFDDLALKANKKSVELKTKVDDYFAELNKVLLNRQKNLNEKVANFFELINNKIHAYSNIPNDILAKADLWKQNVKNYFEMFNEITEKDDVIFKIIDSKVNSQDFIVSAEQIMDEYIKLKNFPFKDLGEVIENVGVEFDNEDDNKVNDNNTTIDLFNSTKNTKKFLIKSDLIERLEKIGVFNLNTDSEKINILLQLDENDQRKIDNIKTEKKMAFNLNNLENLEKNLNNLYSGNKIQESNSKESLININNNNLSIKGEFLNNSSVSNTTTKLADEIMTFSNNNHEDNHQYMTNQFINSENNSFLNLSDDSLVFQNKNLKTKSIFDKTKDPIVHSNPIGNKHFSDNNNHSNIIKINSNTNLNFKSRSPPKLTSDKLIFIKTQMKNDTANFTNYDIGDEGCKCISDLLSTKSCKVKEIRLKKSNVTDEGFALLCKALENNNSVTILNLSRNLLSEKSLENIINLIKYNKNLKTINLDGNSYSTAIKEKIKSYVRKDLKICF